MVTLTARIFRPVHRFRECAFGLPKVQRGLPKRWLSPNRLGTMLAAFCVAFATFGSGQASVPRYTLEAQDAPTAALFAMMLDGGESTNVSVMRHFPVRVSLRMREDQIALPPPDLPGRGYGDYWPIGGWILGMQRATQVKGLVVGYEREGGSFYISCADQPNTAGSEDYMRDTIGAWHRIGSTGEPVGLPADVSRSALRLAAVRWLPAADLRRAILVARSSQGESLTRVVKKGDRIGIAGYRVSEIDARAISLTGSPLGPIRLDLRGN